MPKKQRDRGNSQEIIGSLYFKLKEQYEDEDAIEELDQVYKEAILHV